MKTTRGTEEVRQWLREWLERRASPGWRADLCGCVPELVRMMDEAHDRSAASLSTSVRDLVVERCMTGAGQAAHDPDELDAHVRLVLDAMDRARRKELRHGEWDSTPVPPLMFG